MTRFQVKLSDANLQDLGKTLDFNFADAMLLGITLEDGRTINLHFRTNGEVSITTFGNRPNLTGYVPQSQFLTHIYPEKPFTCSSCGHAIFDEDVPHCVDCK